MSVLASFLHYLSTVFLFTKLANVFMFYWANPVYAIIYGAACIVQMVMFPEPAFSGPEKVLYFRGPNLHVSNTVFPVEFSESSLHFFTGWNRSRKTNHLAGRILRQLVSTMPASGSGLRLSKQQIRLAQFPVRQVGRRSLCEGSWKVRAATFPLGSGWSFGSPFPSWPTLPILWFFQVQHQYESN